MLLLPSPLPLPLLSPEVAADAVLVDDDDDDDEEEEEEEEEGGGAPQLWRLSSFPLGDVDDVVDGNSSEAASDGGVSLGLAVAEAATAWRRGVANFGGRMWSQANWFRADAAASYSAHERWVLFMGKEKKKKKVHEKESAEVNR
jgi:hypothetical protein